MKKITVTLALLLLTAATFAQNVGVGLTTGIDARLHVAKADSGLLILDNTTAFADSAKSKLFFRTGGWYTGGVGTHVQSGPDFTARLGLYTYAANDPRDLRERLSILDNGNVGINTVVPTARLDVNGTFRLRGNGAADGKILTSDAAGNALWIDPPASGLTLPANFGFSGAGIAFSITSSSATSRPAQFQINNAASNAEAVFGSTNGGTSSVAVRGLSTGTGSAGVFQINNAANSRSALSVSTNGTGAAGSFTGTTALRTEGNVQLTDIGEGAGKVLTSDAAGNATWQSPAGSGQIAFSAYLSNDLTLASGTDYNLTGFTEDFDDGGVFNSATGRFTAPSAGLYAISYNMNFRETGTDTKYVRIYVRRNGSPMNAYNHIVPGISSTSSSSFSNSLIVKLSQSDYLTLSVERSAASGNVLNGGNFANSSYFSVHKVY